MKEECHKIREMLLDDYSADFKITDEIASHIEKCSECKEFYRQLVKLSDSLSIDLEPIQVDYQSIKIAIDAGTKKREAKENILNNICFFIISVALFTILGSMVNLGYVNVVFIIQVLMIVICPFAIPIVLYKQLKGGA